MFHVTDEDKFLGLIDAVAAEPIDDEPYSIVKNPKPVVETVCTFDGVQIDLESWSKSNGVATDSNKVGKAKTASDLKLAKAAPKTSAEKKDDGKVVEKDEVDDKKKKDQIVEVNAEAEVKAEKAPEAGKGGEFDKAAKSAATSQEGEAKSNKKFAPGCDTQKRIDLFKKGVAKLGVDEKSKADATKVLKEFDKISSYLKPKTESVGVATELDDVALNKLYERIHQIMGQAEDGLLKPSDAVNMIKLEINKQDTSPVTESALSVDNSQAGAYGVNGYVEYSDGWG